MAPKKQPGPPPSAVKPANPDQDVTTIYGETFTADESAKLAWLLYKRFGRCLTSSAVAWRRMMGNDCDDHDFKALVERGRKLP